MKTCDLFCSLIVVAFSCLHIQCKETPPEPPPPATVTLKAEDASSTEAWLKATTTQVPAVVRLVRLNPTPETLQTLQLTTPDSLLIDEGLLPRHTYTFQLQKLGADSSVTETSASVQATTMDTTSHNFTFQIDTLGDGNASTLYDVAIINDTLAYAVGEIYLRDSTGGIDPQAYNMARWNGLRWELLRIEFYTFCGQPGTGSYPAKSIFAFSPTEIWIGMDGSQVVRWDGQNQSTPTCTPVSINKLWGENPNSVYAVGNGGGVAHYNGSTWQRLESGTSVRLTDIWGASDGSEVWACGFNDTNGGTVVLRLVNGASQIVWDRLAPPRPPYIYISYLSSLWSSGRGEFVAVGGRFYRNSLLNINIVRNEYIPTLIGTQLFQLGNFAYRVRGSERNDVFLAGDDAMIWHWNGTTWYQYSEITNSIDRLYGLAVSPTKIVAVGTRYSGINRRALVLRGRR